MRRALEVSCSSSILGQGAQSPSLVIPPTLALLSTWLVYATPTEMALWRGVLGFVLSIALGYVATR